MGKFINDATGVVVSVADEKDDRFGEGWKPADQPPKKTTAKASKPSTKD